MTLVMFKKLIQEPLLHFILLGVGIFLLFDIAGVSEPDADTLSIHISQSDIEGLSTHFEAVWRRPPNADELNKLIDNLIQEEVLVREARALRMDQGDAVIRNRLRQKMDFVATSLATSNTPSQDELRQFYRTHKDAFRLPARFSFQQIMLAPEFHGQAQQITDALNQNLTPEGITNLGLLPDEIPLTLALKIDGIFGSGFSTVLADLPVGEWAGPVPSGFGLHLVRVSGKTDEEIPDFSDIQSDVLAKWREFTRTSAQKDFRQMLEGKYEISVAPLPRSGSE